MFSARQRPRTVRGCPLHHAVAEINLIRRVSDWAIQHHFHGGSLGKHCVRPTGHQHPNEPCRGTRRRANSGAHSGMAGDTAGDDADGGARRRRFTDGPGITRLVPLALHLAFGPIQFLAGPSDLRESAFGRLLRGIAWITLVVAPVLLLLTIQIQFLPYHSSFVAWTQRIALLFDLMLVWWLWRKVLSGGERDATAPVVAHGRAGSPARGASSQTAAQALVPTARRPPLTTASLVVRLLLQLSC